MSKQTTAADNAWAIIDNEKRRDRFIRRVSITAWSVTFAIVLLVAIMVSAQLVQMIKGVRVGTVPWSAVIGSAMPLVDVLWKLSLLVAALSTVGIFLRLRTASLAEIQLRLATLEELLANRPDAQQS
jgi:hypothetical protein